MSVTLKDVVSKAKEDFDALFRERDRIVVVHYTSEGLEPTSRISFVGLHWYGTVETEVLPSGALESRFLNGELGADPYACEKEMLLDYAERVREHKDAIWAHWNMRSNSFGFLALADRMAYHGIDVSIPPMSRRFDLARRLVERYGSGYAPHRRLPSICDLNQISRRDYVEGPDEPGLMESGRRSAVRHSVSRKVEMIAGLLACVETGNLAVANEGAVEAGREPDSGAVGLAAELDKTARDVLQAVGESRVPLLQVEVATKSGYGVTTVKRRLKILLERKLVRKPEGRGQGVVLTDLGKRVKKEI